MGYRTLCLLCLALVMPSALLGHLEDLEHDGNYVTSEEFPVQEANEDDGPHFLRRHLQTTNVCQATVPHNVFACGGYAGGDSDPCKNSVATCAGEFPEGYSCSCTESSDTTCTYCQVRTKNAILCQVTGSKSTFIALDGTMQTCQCDFVGGGQVHQTCYTPSPPPVPLPTLFPVPSVPTGEVRNPDTPGDSVVTIPTDQPSLAPQKAFAYVPKTTLRDQYKLYHRVRGNADMP